MLSTADAQTRYVKTITTDYNPFPGSFSTGQPITGTDYVVLDENTNLTNNVNVLLIHDSIVYSNGTWGNPSHRGISNVVTSFTHNGPSNQANYQISLFAKQFGVLYGGGVGSLSFVVVNLAPPLTATAQAATAQAFPQVNGATSTTNTLCYWNNLLVAGGSFTTVQTSSGTQTVNNIFACDASGTLHFLGAGLPDAVRSVFILPKNNTLCALVNNHMGYYTYDAVMNTWSQVLITGTNLTGTTYNDMMHVLFTDKITDSTTFMVGGFETGSGCWNWSGSWILNTNTQTITIDSGATVWCTGGTGIQRVWKTGNPNELYITGDALYQGIRMYNYGPWICSSADDGMLFNYKTQTYQKWPGLGLSSYRVDAKLGAIYSSIGSTQIIISDTVADPPSIADPATGIGNITSSENQLRIIGNPVTNTIIIESESDGMPIKVVNILGQNVLSIPQGNHITTTDVTHLPNGMYYIIQNEPNGTTKSAKFVKE